MKKKTFQSFYLKKKKINTEKKKIKMSVMLTFNNEYVNCHEKGLD